MVQIKIKDANNTYNREVAFVKKVPHTEKVSTDDYPHGYNETVYYWEPDSEDFFECKLSIDAFGKRNIDKTTVMLIIDTTTTAHSFSPSSIDDWEKVFYSYTRRIYSNQTDKYSVIYLLWCLYNQELYESIFEQALRKIKSKSLDLICEILPKIAICLSISKQNGIKRVLNHLGITYDIYNPKTLHEAYENQQGLKQPYEKLGLFDKLDYIYSTISLPLTGMPMPFIEQKKDLYTGGNILLSIKEWLGNSNYIFTDDKNLIKWFQLLSTDIQLNIVRRYFNAIYDGKAVFSNTFIQNLKSNVKYDIFGIYRHCISAPLAPTKIVVPLLCDCLLTLNETKGEYLQTYNGILDLAIRRCDVGFPKVDFGLEKIFPTCDGGATCNPSFKGFAKISCIYKLKESALSDSTLFQLVNDIFGRCKQVMFIEESIQHDPDYICTVEERSQYIELLNLFTDLHVTYNAIGQKTHNISHKDILLDKFRNKIKTLGTKHEHGYTFDELSPIYNMIIDRCFDKEFIQVSPYKDVYLNTDLNLYNLDVKKADFNSTKEEKEKIERENRAKEALKVYQLVIQSLDRYPNSQKVSEGVYLFKYTPKLFDNLVKEYHYQKGAEENFYSGNFIQHYSHMKFTRFCAPKYETVQHVATGLPYFWCNGKMCFKNNLGKQTVGSCASYQDYTLFHMTEIMGYSKLCHTPAGYEPNETFRKFSALINRVYTIFKRLKCKECGSLIFPVTGTVFGAHNYYACNNKLCSLYKISTYLNYCYNCKRGLIDSRDTKQCPNGWYICPSCLSCCDDTLIAKIIQKFVITHKPVPLSLQNQVNNGHNNKDKFFCSRCGTKLTKNTNPNINADWMCKNCKSTYKRHK